MKFSQVVHYQTVGLWCVTELFLFNLILLVSWNLFLEVFINFFSLVIVYSDLLSQLKQFSMSANNVFIY